MNDSNAITFVAFLVSSAAVVAVCVSLGLIRLRARNAVVRACVLSGVLLALVVAPALFDQLILRLNATSGLQRVYIDPSAATLSAPSLLGLVAFLLSSLLPRRIRG
jgi:hypothetical protein